MDHWRLEKYVVSHRGRFECNAVLRAHTTLCTGSSIVLLLERKARWRARSTLSLTPDASRTHEEV